MLPMSCINDMYCFWQHGVRMIVHLGQQEGPVAYLVDFVQLRVQKKKCAVWSELQQMAWLPTCGNLAPPDRCPLRYSLPTDTHTNAFVVLITQRLLHLPVHATDVLVTLSHGDVACCFNVNVSDWALAFVSQCSLHR